MERGDAEKRKSNEAVTLNTLNLAHSRASLVGNFDREYFTTGHILHSAKILQGNKIWYTSCNYFIVFTVYFKVFRGLSKSDFGKGFTTNTTRSLRQMQLDTHFKTTCTQ